jgi:phytoene dehydrogenase-like protein
MCVADWLNEWFETERLGCVLAGPALFHGFVGPWSPGTTALLARHEVTTGRAVRGGPAALVAALVRAADAVGVRTRPGTPVAAVRFEGGRVRGVALEGGEDVDAGAVVATCDPVSAILRLVPREERTPRLTRRMATYRCAGSTAVVNLALGAAPRFAGRPDLTASVVRTGATFDEQERAFDPAKYGHVGDAPLLEIHLASHVDASCAPAGGATVTVFAHAVPASPPGGWTAELRERLGDAVQAALERCAPGTGASVKAREILAPPDLEERYGVSGGHLLHGEHGLDQLLARPVPECASGTPWPGFVLGGAGSWPGGGLTGAPGALAAARVREVRF